MSECINGNCPVTQSADYHVIKELPTVVPADHDCPLFNSIWDAIKGKRLECPDYYTGWTIATGRHVKLIIDMIKEAK